MVVGKRKLKGAKGAISAPCGDPEIAHELDSVGQESFVLLSCNNSDS